MKHAVLLMVKQYVLGSSEEAIAEAGVRYIFSQVCAVSMLHIGPNYSAVANHRTLVH